MKKYDEKEQIILNLPGEYLIFLDEVGDPFLHWDTNAYKDPSLFPVMTVTAVVVSKIAYKNILMPGLDELKEYFFKDKNIYFHSREIRRKDGIFKIFLNEKIYSGFKRRIDILFTKSLITIISSSINKLKLAAKAQAYRKISGQKYNIGDIYLRNVGYVLERIGHLLNQHTGKIIFESRGKKESKRIQAVLSDAKRDGTFYCSKERFVNISDKILFFEKKDNINGLQVVDYCAYPFARHTKNPKDKDNKFFDFLRGFIPSEKTMAFMPWMRVNLAKRRKKIPRPSGRV